MKTDSRIIQTKRAIKSEIINLLRQYPLNKITVKMLCNKAEINRATFYRYYEDVYDLYDKIKAQFIDEIFAVFQDANLLQTQDNIKTFLAEVKKNSDMIYALTNQRDAIAFTYAFCQKVYSGVEKEFGEFFAEFNRQQCKEAYTFVVSGCAGILALLLNSLISKVLKTA